MTDCGNCANYFCLPCRKRRALRRRSEDPETRRLARRRYQLKYKYGISPEDYDGMVADQSGKCALCDAELWSKLVVDHCHKTGRVRGLLCNPCNTHLPDIAGRSAKAAKVHTYLEGCQNCV